MADFKDLLSQAKEMQKKMKETQEALQNIEVEGVSGGNVVKIIMNGDGELKKITLDDVLFKESKEIIEGLQKFKGIGIWSASIFALFYLNHPDVFAWGDISIKKSIKLLYEEDQEMENERIIEITSKWIPYRSTACIVLWKWLDEGAIKFS